MRSTWGNIIIRVVIITIIIITLIMIIMIMIIIVLAYNTLTQQIILVDNTLTIIHITVVY